MCDSAVILLLQVSWDSICRWIRHLLIVLPAASLGRVRELLQLLQPRIVRRCVETGRQATTVMFLWVRWGRSQTWLFRDHSRRPPCSGLVWKSRLESQNVFSGASFPEQQKQLLGLNNVILVLVLMQQQHLQQALLGRLSLVLITVVQAAFRFRSFRNKFPAASLPIRPLPRRRPWTTLQELRHTCGKRRVDLKNCLERRNRNEGSSCTSTTLWVAMIQAWRSQFAILQMTQRWWSRYFLDHERLSWFVVSSS